MDLEQTLYDLKSPKRSHTFWGLMGTLAVCAILLWLKHGEWLAQPNEQMLGSGGDGLKNTMTTAWHVRHDSSYVHYGGMNYPYGEHVLFTDCQPVFTTLLQWWSHNVSYLGEKTVGWMGVFLVLSLLLGCAGVFLLLRKLHLPVWLASTVALGMTFLAPQYNRFDGHFGLSHTFVIPWMLLLLCSYEERLSRRYQSLHIGLLVWFAAQLHFYYLGMAALFLSLYIGYQILRKFTWRNIRRRMSHWVVMVLLPFVALNVWVHWSDYATDRPSQPYGFTSYIGYWEGVLLPYDFMPLHQWINQHITHIREIDFEAKAYAGALAFFFTLGLLLWLLAWLPRRAFFPNKKFYAKSWDDAAYHRVHKQYLRGILFAAFVLLLFSCGFPFAIPGMDWLVNYLGPLRQFRGLGRFTWVYFYVVNVLIFYGLWNWGRRYTGRWPLAVRTVSLALPLLVLCWEALIFQQKKHLEFQTNVTRTDVVTADPKHWLTNVDYKQFQSLLPLPYYHLGSENIWLSYDNDHFRRVQVTALYSGLGDMGVNLSRTSAEQTVRSVQLILEPGQQPAILDDLPNDKPLCLLVNTFADSADVYKKYRHLLRKATLAYSHPDLKVYRLELDSLRAYVREHAHEVASEMDSRPLQAVASTPWRATNEGRPIIYQSFDSLTQTAEHFRGTGAYQGLLKDTTLLWQGTLPKGVYTFSCWLRADVDMGMNNEVKIVENAASDGHEVHLQHEGLRFYVRSIVNGWALVELGFQSYEGQPMRIWLQKRGADAPFWVDEMLIKPLNTEVYRREGGWVSRNNFWYEQ